MATSKQIKKELLANRRVMLEKYYDAYLEGYRVSLFPETFDENFETHIILSKHKLDDEYYFVVQSRMCSISIVKLVYNGEVGFIKLSPSGNQYLKYKDVFDSWIQVAKDNRSCKIGEYYRSFTDEYSLKNDKNEQPKSMTVLSFLGKVEMACFVLKKEYNGKYYFVMRLSNGCDIVAKLVYNNGLVQPKILNIEEFRRDKENFETWLDEAKKQINT